MLLLFQCCQVQRQVFQLSAAWSRVPLAHLGFTSFPILIHESKSYSTLCTTKSFRTFAQASNMCWQQDSNLRNVQLTNHISLLTLS